MSVNLNLTDDEAHTMLILLRRIRQPHTDDITYAAQLARHRRIASNLSEVRRKLEAAVKP